MPEEELEILSQRLRAALDLDPSSSVPALQALLREEMRRRADAAQA
ncbi:hypothetical protein [Pseudarthrobacter niigatensis]|uniref:Uncharacterized protein n=1 Tax=Pseudarthrobacter niigatensis TaxID=369935 RepID=A0AAJ1SVQ5_9MICC|nr:hypothetical protein [Pseudarthrobacter niigatensis]MDQ0147956.1 hypothetical protein [Pseudarthrobacter niigatensis]MDQ0268040.1 hypothetical protein [Pseudarthrobacter niigatensis]